MDYGHYNRYNHYNQCSDYNDYRDSDLDLDLDLDSIRNSCDVLFRAVKIIRCTVTEGIQLKVETRQASRRWLLNLDALL